MSEAAPRSRRRHDWHNALPEWITRSDSFRKLRPQLRHTLQSIADACDPPDESNSLLGAYGGAGRFSELIGCSKRTFWRHLGCLERLGFVVLVGHGGPFAFRNASNSYAVPGVLGSLDDRAARRTCLQMLKSPDGVYRPQILRPGDQATLWPKEAVTGKMKSRNSQSPPPSDKLTLPYCQVDTLPSPVPFPCKTTMGLLRSGTSKTINRITKAKGASLPNVELSDLTNAGRLTGLFYSACERGIVAPCDDDRLRFFAAAEHALRVGATPAALFAAMVNRGEWHLISIRDENRGAARLKRHLHGQEPRKG